MHMHRRSCCLARVALLIGLAMLLTAHSGAARTLANPQFIVAAAELGARLGQPDLVLIDARGPEQYEGGHIPGAVNLPPAALERTETRASGAEVTNLVLPADQITRPLRAAGISGNSQVVIYSAGGDRLAARVWWVLDYYGHPNSAVLDGGLLAWDAAGGELDIDTVSANPGDFVPVADPARIADFDYLESHLDDEGVSIINSTSPEAYAAEAIPGSTNLPYASVFDIDSASILKPQRSLEDLLAEGGVDPEGENVFYCTGGHFSAHNYWVARTLGIENVRVYDGSLFDWKARGAGIVGTGTEPSKPVAELFSGGMLANVDMAGPDMTEAEMTRAEVEAMLANATEAKPADLARRRLNGLDLRGLDFKGADLRWARLNLADLRGANLSNVKLDLAWLLGANLEGVDLSGASLFSAQMQGARAQNAIFDEARIAANLERADLRGASFVGANMAADMKNQSMGLMRTTLRSANLDQADLSGADASRMDAEFASLRDTTLDNANFTGTELSGADLTGASVSGLNLTEADVDSASLLSLKGEHEIIGLDKAKNLSGAFR